MKTSSKKKTIAWHSIVFFFIIVMSYKVGTTLSYKDLEPLVSILQNTSAMIFTIIGIWIAYIYPNAVASIVQPSKITALLGNEDIKRAKLLVAVLILSASIMGILVFGIAIKSFLIKTVFFANYLYILKFIGAFFILLITYAQLFCLYVVIASSVNFIIDLRNFQAKKVLAKKLDR